MLSNRSTSLPSLNILFVTPYYKPAHVYGGPSYSIPTLCESLVDTGAKVTVFTTNANGHKDLPVPHGVSQDIDGVHVYYFKRDVPGNYFYSAQLRSACVKRIRRSVFDLVYVASNWGYPFLPACRAAYQADIPYVVSPRASFKRNTWRGKFLKKASYHLVFERALIQKASRLHYTTSLELSDSRWLRLRPREMVIPNPLNIQEFDRLPAEGKFRRRFGIPNDKKLILILGRIDPEKGLELGLHTLHKVIQQYPDALLVIAGPEENNYVQVLKGLAQELQVGDQIFFPGFLNSSERLEALVDANVFFSPSRSENFGMSIVEAMACGLPVVVSDQAGVANLILREDAGLVVPLDPEQMANTLLDILNSTSLGQQIKQRAAYLVNREFAPRPVTKHILREFAEILREKK